MTGPTSEQAFPQVLREALEQRGLSLERASAALAERGHRVSAASLSYWQSGRSAPTRPRSRAAVAELERLLDLPTGRLVDLLPPVTPKSPQLADLSERHARLDALAERLGLDWLAHEEVQLSSCWLVDERRRGVGFRNHEIVRVGDPDALYPVGIFHRVNGVAIDLRMRCSATIETMSGETGDSFIVAGLRLPPARRGEHVMVAFDVAYDFSGAPALEVDSAGIAVDNRVAEATLRVQFTKGAVPETVRMKTRVPGGDPVTRTVLPVGGCVDVARYGFGPGEIGMTWSMS